MEIILDALIGIDVRLMYLINVSLHNPVFNWIMPIFHDDHLWRIPLALVWIALMVFGSSRMRWIGLGALIILLLTDPISSRILKPFVGRIRPCNILNGLNLWKGGIWMVTPDQVIEIYKSSYSFPSSHATNIGGQAFWWGWAYPKTRWIWYGVAFVVGFSRVYDGVHWPIDVVAGWVTGGLIFGVFSVIVVQWGPKSLRKTKPIVSG